MRALRGWFSIGPITPHQLLGLRHCRSTSSAQHERVWAGVPTWCAAASCRSDGLKRGTSCGLPDGARARDVIPASVSVSSSCSASVSRWFTDGVFFHGGSAFLCRTPVAAQGPVSLLLPPLSPSYRRTMRIRRCGGWRWCGLRLLHAAAAQPDIALPSKAWYGIQRS